MDKVGIPLCTETCAARADIFGYPSVILKVFCDRDPAGKFLGDLVVDPLKKAPAVGQFLRAAAIYGTDILGAVEADAVHVVFFEPHEDIVAQIFTHLVASVIGPGFSPRRDGPVVVVKVDSTAIILEPAVKLPKIKVAGTQMVVDNVQEHRDTLLMGALDELLERNRAAIVKLNGINMGRVVTPRPFSGKLTHRHDLKGIDAQLFQMSQTCRHRSEFTRLFGLLLVVERAHMELVDDQLVPGREMEVIPLPVKARVVDDCVAGRSGHFAGIRVNAPEFALLRGQQELVFVADSCFWHISVPVTVLLGLHRVFSAVPAVERSYDGYPLCMGRPNTEPDPPCVGNCPHPLGSCIIAHGDVLPVFQLVIKPRS